MTSHDALPIGRVLEQHLRAQGLPSDSGVSQRWVSVRFAGLPFLFPNFDARRRVLVTHDVHHLLTGYGTTLRGEAQISGFELGSGCWRYGAAWFFGILGLALGLVIAPVRTYRAFVRGRHAANYYGTPDAVVLRKSVDQAQRELGLGRPTPPATMRDVLAFLAHAGLVLLPGAVPLAAAWLAAF